MPCILKIRVIRARDLPVMDKATDLTDAYVEVRFGDHDVQRTPICRKSLNPTWNADFRIEVSDDADLQNEPVELRVLDYDTISANDVVGCVLIDINPLLAWESSSILSTSNNSNQNQNQPVAAGELELTGEAGANSERQITGWFPLYDTLCGVRGEVNVQIKLQFFGDVNPFKDSSAGVCIFSCPTIPAGYVVEESVQLGLVDVLASDSDPEFSWADTFRAPRTSNESRQRVMYRLSGKLRRLMGRQVLELNGNAVIGFKQYFDFESEGGLITGRAIGTCVRLVSSQSNIPVQLAPIAGPIHDSISVLGEGPTADEVGRKEVIDSAIRESVNIDHEEDDAILSRQTTAAVMSPLDEIAYQNPVDPVLLTVHSLPEYGIRNIGGLVSAKSVKLYQGNSVTIREDWWWELREEVQNHAKQLGCKWVMGYSETAAFKDELCVLSAIGTAVNIDIDSLTVGEVLLQQNDNDNTDKPNQPTRNVAKQDTGCRCCHIPYSRKAGLPFPMSVEKCLQCGRRSVPEFLFATIEPPEELGIVGTMKLVEAHVCRTKKRKEGESNAAIVSDSLPFIEYDLHRQLLFKLRVLGSNAIFGIKFRLSIGDGWIVAVASGTACCIAALPLPQPIKINRSIETADRETMNVNHNDSREAIESLCEANRKRLEELRLVHFSSMHSARIRNDSQTVPRLNNSKDDFAPPISADTDASSDDEYMTDNFARQNRRLTSAAAAINEVSTQVSYVPRTSTVVQIDDDADEDLIAVLADPCRYQDNFIIYTVNESRRWRESLLSAVNREEYSCLSQMQTVIKEAHLSLTDKRPNAQLASFFNELYDSVKWSCDVDSYNLFHAVNVDIDMPDDGMLHIKVNGMVSSICRCAEITEGVKQSRRKSLSTNSRIGNAVDNEAAAETSSPRPSLAANPSLTMTRSLQQKDETEDDEVTPDDDDDEEKGVSQSSIQAMLLNASPSHTFVEITPLYQLLDRQVTSYRGRISLHFVKEDLNLHHIYGNHYVDMSYQQADEAVDDDLGRFIHSFMIEIQAVLRAHTIALGGNAILGYRVEHSEFYETVKNQAYGMISVAGDIVHVESDLVDVRGGRVMEKQWDAR